MSTVNSNVKLITSNKTPTTDNLAKGEMAFGQVAGVNSIYGNTGNDIIKIEFTSSGKQIIYFANEDGLTNFLDGSDIPTGGWYAVVANKVYSTDTPYVQYSLSTDAPLGAGINDLKFSDEVKVGEIDSVNIRLSDDHNIKIDTDVTPPAILCTVDAFMLKSSPTQNTPPAMKINLHSAFSGSSDTISIDGVWDSVHKRINWQGEFNIGQSEITMETLDKTTNLYGSIMQYNDSDGTVIQGTIKFEGDR